MRIANGALILETRPCHCVWGPTGPGTQAGRKPCQSCGGTGRGKRGAERGCKSCYGFGTSPDFEKPVTCGNCGGSGNVPESNCDPISTADFLSIPMRVIRQDRGQSWNEAHLAVGYLWTCTDYGRAWAGTDEDLLSKIRGTDSPSVQASKVCNEEGAVCSYIAVLVHPQGYSLRACFAPA